MKNRTKVAYSASLYLDNGCIVKEATSDDVAEAHNALSDMVEACPDGHYVILWVCLSSDGDDRWLKAFDSRDAENAIKRDSGGKVYIAYKGHCFGW